MRDEIPASPNKEGYHGKINFGIGCNLHCSL